MKIVNDTDYDGRRVASIIRWVFRELDVHPTGHLVRVEYHNGNWGGSGHAWPARYEILCKIGNENWHPDLYPVDFHIYERKADMPEPFPCENWEQALVAICAHEAMHLRQARLLRQGRRHRRQRGKEQECDYAAYRLWKRWTQREAKRQEKEQKCAVSSSPSNVTQAGKSNFSSSVSNSSSHHSQLTITLPSELSLLETSA